MFTIKTATLELAKRAASWGTYGKGGWEHCHGRCPLHQYREVRLVDCTTEHLQTLLNDGWVGEDSDYATIIRAILDDRGEPHTKPEYVHLIVLQTRVHYGVRQYRIVVEKRRIS